MMCVSIGHMGLKAQTYLRVLKAEHCGKVHGRTHSGKIDWFAPAIFPDWVLLSIHLRRTRVTKWSTAAAAAWVSTWARSADDLRNGARLDGMTRPYLHTESGDR